MINALGLLKRRRFLPLFATQFLGAFNDNLFKTSMVLFATYEIFNDPRVEANFNALATGIGILPFFLLSALAGQLADSHDKARIIRIVKAAEIGIMTVGAGGLLLASRGFVTAGMGLMLGAVLLLGVHSTFFGPIKYALLPQHLEKDDVLGGTGLVEAGTYLAILTGTVAAGFFTRHIWMAAVAVLAVALVGFLTGRLVPPAPREGAQLKLNFNPFTASWRLIAATMHIPRLFLSICAISFFWTIGAVLIIVFPPLVKNVLTANEQVASFVIATFSVGVAIGSVVINAMLRGRISARYSPASVIAMGALVVLFSIVSRGWTPAPAGQLYALGGFLAQPKAVLVLLCLLGIAVTGGMFVVPLYAWLQTHADPAERSRVIAANNVVNAVVTVALTIVAVLLTGRGAGVPEIMGALGVATLPVALAMRRLR